MEQSYDNYQDFNETSDRDKSWFPDLISSDCYKIKEVHNIDNNNSFGVFNYRNESRIDSLISKTATRTTIEDFETFINRVKNPKRPKWFLDFENSTGLMFYKAKNMAIAKDHATKKIYFVYSTGD